MNKTFQPGNKSSRFKIILLINLLILPMLLGCWLTDVVLGQKPKRPDLEEGGTAFMDATGSFLANTAPGWTYTYSQNTITLSWQVYDAYGQAKPEVVGVGKIKESEPSRGCEHDMDLAFTGTVTQDGDDFTGTVHVTGMDSCPDGYSMPIDYTTDWTATRRGDFIEGSVVALGPFRLDVQPAHP